MLLANMPSEIRVTEVGPRDGLQNEKQQISTEVKVKYIQKLIEAGLKNIEVTSFVSAKAIPQMGDAQDVFEQIHKKFGEHKELRLSCLIPNEKGYEKAIDVGVEHFAFFNATSEEFSKKNVNGSIEEVFQRVIPVIEDAKKKKVAMRGYISTVFGCPYQGDISLQQVMPVVERFLSLGVRELSFGDTIGVATPRQVETLTLELKKVMPLKDIVMHFHDTRGMAVANSLMALQLGVSHFDSSSGGLGGCPYAKGATGNMATEDLFYLAYINGIETGIDIATLSQASQLILQEIGKETTSKFLKAYNKSGKIR